VNFHVYHHHSTYEEKILKLLEKIMASLAETLAAVTAESTRVDSIDALLEGLAAQIKAGGLSAADQATVDAIFASATAASAKIDVAIAANTPPVTPPVVPVP
jgi:hypothetical protein